MRRSHFLLGLLLMMIWGLQFPMIRLATQALPPFLLGAVRFFFTSIPLVFFIKKPKIPLKMLLLYGWCTFALQYGLLFSAIHQGIFSGLAALIYQFQIFINIGLAYVFFQERVHRAQCLGILIAFCGIALVGVHALQGNITLLGFCLAILAPTAWAFGNIALKKSPSANALALVVWGNLISVPPMILVGLLCEGGQKWLAAWQHLSWSTVGAAAYIVYFSTLLGFSLWSWLLIIYPIKTVVPFMMLVPPISMLAGFFVLNEGLSAWELYAALFILSGLAINFFGDSWFEKMNKRYRAARGIER
jgi:O-acetylserine/cysteine efflux transporter